MKLKICTRNRDNLPELHLDVGEEKTTTKSPELGVFECKNKDKKHVLHFQVIPMIRSTFELNSSKMSIKK